MGRTPLVAALLLGPLLLAPPAMGQQEDVQAYNKAMELYRAAKYREALPFFARALELAEGRYGAESPLLAPDLNDLAEVHRQLGNAKTAEALYRRAIAFDQQAGGDGPGLATSLNNLALLYRTQNRLREAEPLYKRSLALLEGSLGPNHPDVAKGLNNLAILYRMRGEPENARPLQERALAIAAKALGPEHATTKLYRRNLDLVAPPSAASAVVAATAPVASAGGSRPRAGLPTAARPPAPTAPPVAVARAPVPSPPPAARPPPAVTRRAVPPAVAAPPAPPPAAPSRAAGNAAGGFALHLASLRDPAGAPAEWRRLRRLYPALLGGLELRPARAVEVPGQGTFYRVAGGAFATLAEAQGACARLRAAGQYCVVVAAS